MAGAVQYRIAHYYYQYVIATIAKTTKQDVIEAKGVYKGQVKLKRNDTSSVIVIQVFNIRKHMDELKTAEEEIDKIMETFETVKDLKVAWWYYKNGDIEVAMPHQQSSKLELVYANHLKTGALAKAEHDINLSNNLYSAKFDKEAKNKAILEPKDTKKDAKDIIVTRKIDEIEKHKAELPRTLEG